MLFSFCSTYLFIPLFYPPFFLPSIYSPPVSRYLPVESSAMDIPFISPDLPVRYPAPVPEPVVVATPPISPVKSLLSRSACFHVNKDCPAVHGALSLHPLTDRCQPPEMLLVLPVPLPCGHPLPSRMSATLRLLLISIAAPSVQTGHAANLFTEMDFRHPVSCPAMASCKPLAIECRSASLCADIRAAAAVWDAGILNLLHHQAFPAALSRTAGTARMSGSRLSYM